jgi:oxaloacetate decarboxylase gamma subunit
MESEILGTVGGGGLLDAGLLGAGLLGESLRLMLIGMSIVFGFLILLVVLLRAMSWLAERLSPAERHANPSGDAPQAGGATTAAEDDLVAVIAAAVSLYRAQHLSRH